MGDRAYTEHKTRLRVRTENWNAPLVDVVFLSALGVEFRAIQKHLRGGVEEHQDDLTKTSYKIGCFLGDYRIWRVALREIGMGNMNAAAETERAIRIFRPRVVFFVGVAGGLKDVSIGDVIAADKVYSYEPGRIDPKFRSRPSIVGGSTAQMKELARNVSRKRLWTKRLPTEANRPEAYGTASPTVAIAPIVSGEKVIASRSSPQFKLFQNLFNDACAVEMEGGGFCTAAQAYRRLEHIIVRGISDLIDGKAIDDSAGSQEWASATASAFAFEMLFRLKLEKHWKRRSRDDLAVPTLKRQLKVPTSPPTVRLGSK